MSYILDALRRADAERERDPARGIHAQPLAPAAARGDRGHVASWAWAGAVVAAAGAAAYAWWPRPQVPVAPAVSQATPVALPVAVAVAPAVTPAAVASHAAVTPLPSVAPHAAVAPLPPAAPHARPAAPVHTVAVAPASVLKAPPVHAAPVANAAPAAKAPPANAAPAAVAASAPALPVANAAAAMPARIYAVSELPADVQRELPKLAISGGVSSENPAQRMLIVGGQVMSEGAELAPGVVLEQIRPKTAVLRFRGYRYSVVY